MSVAAGKLITQANACIALANQDVLKTAQLAGIQAALNGIYSVANCAALPVACDNTGRFIWVTDIGDYRYSDGTQWTNDVNTTWTGACLFGWGWNLCGGLGNNTTAAVSSPVREISSSCNWVTVTSNITSAGIKSDLSLWTWGYNTCGALGNNSTANQSSPVREISSSSTWTSVGSFAFHLLALKCDSTLWAWGDNFCGNLGDGTKTARSSPIQEVSSSNTWCSISSGGLRHSAAIKSDGSLWTWGVNTCGVLGTNNTTNFSSPVREITSGTSWCRIQNGYNLSVALKKDNTLWSWGSGGYGVLGNNSTSNASSPVQEVSSSTTWCTFGPGKYHSNAIKTDGTLWAWGLNTCGELGNNSATSRSSPIQEISSSTTWCQVSGGCAHTAALKTDGTLWTWGNASCGALGNNTVTPVSSPVREITSATSWSCVTSSTRQTMAIQGKISGFVAL